MDRDHDRADALARRQRAVLGAADHRRPVADDAARATVHGAQHLDHDRAVRRPRPAARGHRGRPRAGRARLLPALEHHPPAPRSARHRPVPRPARPRWSGAHRPRHRDPRARAVLHRAGARVHREREPGGARLVLVDDPRAAALGDPLRAAGGGDRRRVPLRTAGRPRVGALAGHPVHRGPARELPPLPGVRRVRRERRDGHRVRLDLHEVGRLLPLVITHCLLDAAVFVGYPWVAHAFPQLFR